MQKLLEYGYTDDQKFSESFASSRLQNEGFGKFRVLRDLQAKRVSSSVAQQAVAKIFEDADEKELIDAYLARKYRSVVLHDFLHWIRTSPPHTVDCAPPASVLPQRSPR